MTTDNRCPTAAELRAVRRYLDPRPHIAGEAVQVALGMAIVITAVLPVLGVTHHVHPVAVLALAGTVLLDWIGDLLDKIRSERRRIQTLEQITREGQQ